MEPEAKLSFLINREKALTDAIKWLTTQGAKTGIDTQIMQEKLSHEQSREKILKKISDLNSSIKDKHEKLKAFSPEQLKKEVGATINQKTPASDPIYQIRLRKNDLTYLEPQLIRALKQLKACDAAIERANKQCQHADVLLLKQQELNKVQGEIELLKEQLNTPERNTSPTIRFE